LRIMPTRNPPRSRVVTASITALCRPKFCKSCDLTFVKDATRIVENQTVCIWQNRILMYLQRCDSCSFWNLDKKLRHSKWLDPKLHWLKERHINVRTSWKISIK
jgi:hypothetical protein